VSSRNAVIHFLRHVSGPAIGLEPLRALFPSVSPTILADLLRRYRQVWRRRYRLTGFRLRWHHVGSAWAMDHSEASQPVDGVYPYIFAVRDVASGYQLAWQPVRTTKADEVLAILDDLFQEHGPPLVLKSDNGSAFIAEPTRATMLVAGVSQLFSPAGRPSYNGSLERSNGTLKTYTHQHAVTEGHPFRWTSQDLEEARRLANTISRPYGHAGPSPDDAWRTRTPITAEMRTRFALEYSEQLDTAATDLALDPKADLDHKDRSRLDRLGLSRTLERLGYLTKRRVDRARRKPARLTGQALNRVLAKQRAERDPDGGKVTLAASNARSLRSRQARCMQPLLASSVAHATMRADEPRSAQELATCALRARGPSPHREATNIPWWRRPFTLLLSLFKADKIM